MLNSGIKLSCHAYVYYLCLYILLCGLIAVNGDDLIYSGSGCFDDEEKCTSFVELDGSGDDLITPVYIPPKSSLTSTTTSSLTASLPSSGSSPSSLLPSSHTTTPISEDGDEDEEDCVDEEDDCVDGSGSGEPNSLSPSSSLSSSPIPTERTVIITLTSTVSTTVWNPWIAPNYIRPSISPEDSLIDYEEPVPRSPQPMPPRLPLPPRPYPTTKLRLPTRPTGTPPIINVPLPEIPNMGEKEKQKPTLIIHKNSADTTAMIIGLIAIVLIVIVIVTPLFLFLKVRYRSGSAYKADSSKTLRFLPVSGAPSHLLSSASQQTHLSGQLLDSSSVGAAKNQKTVSTKKKDGMEWYV